MKVYINRILEKEEVKEITNNVLNTAIKFIKSHEGFRATPYIDISGNKTIGYGFITKYLRVNERNLLDSTTAHNIIVRKLVNNIAYAKEKYPKLDYNKLVAVAHLAYCKGFGRIEKHPLHQMLLKDSINENVWIYFSKHELKNKKYADNRRFEVKLFSTFNP